MSQNKKSESLAQVLTGVEAKTTECILKERELLKNKVIDELKLSSENNRYHEKKERLENEYLFKSTIVLTQYDETPASVIPFADIEKIENSLDSSIFYDVLCRSEYCDYTTKFDIVPYTSTKMGR